MTFGAICRNAPLAEVSNQEHREWWKRKDTGDGRQNAHGEYV